MCYKYNVGLLVAIEVLAILFGGWSGFEGNGDWTKVPSTIPVMIFSLVYHDLAPGNDQLFSSVLTFDYFFCFTSSQLYMFLLQILMGVSTYPSNLLTPVNSPCNFVYYDEILMGVLTIFSSLCLFGW